jgi:hypothetical protein
MNECQGGAYCDVESRVMLLRELKMRKRLRVVETK